MIALQMLWLPILVSAVFVFLVSSAIHMASPWHKSDYPKMPNEGAVQDALRPLNIAPGDYMVPRPASRQDMASPEFLDKLNKGPVMILTVMPNGPTPMGKSLGLWFLYAVAVGAMAGYVAWHELHVGTSYRHVFRLVGATAFIGYSVALWQMSIWYRRAWSITFKATVDGVIYAALTAGTFGWLWPR
jgi:hypothetical protein